MNRFQAIIAHGARRGQTNVHRRGPAFQLVVFVMVKQIGEADRSTCSGSLDGREGRMIIYNFIVKENFLPAAPPHIER